MIRELQQALLAAGYNPGAVDGINGQRTMTALCLYMSRGQHRANCEAIGASLAQHGGAYAIFTPLRLAHFMGQLSHESGRFRYMQEIASGAAYEGRRDLGNTQPGDGRRYKGRGPIQLTGRANYRTVGARLGLPLEAQPEIAADPAIGLRIALDYWQSRKINTAADADDIRRVTRLINGGTNGLADRIEETTRARRVLI
ncbi:hypothetical protein IP68_12500 [Blastomonas sp. AAP25]|uniref:glycoside hydrolase family 19 protein n=1 Tax=Blastomonas sp. AAP25 TaxID=1523416 RepID=UPI0006B8A157|nr:glycoside hydrolase family 19 protein [Blastomonas sp. AAP25]KPF74573.1 hypothetical protein IP68_12500 [Blastomonas sp. AAP25]